MYLNVYALRNSLFYVPETSQPVLSALFSDEKLYLWEVQLNKWWVLYFCFVMSYGITKLIKVLFTCQT